MSKKLASQFENNRQTILETTSKLFREKGINATSFSDISKAVKLSKGTIYYYYPSKEHLIREVTEYHISSVTDQIFAWIESLDESTPLLNALVTLLEMIFNTVDKCRLHICLINYSIMSDNVINNMIREEILKWHTMVEIGLVKTGCTKAKEITKDVFMVLDSIILKRIMGMMDMKEKDICVYILKNV